MVRIAADSINLWLDDIRPAPDGWVWAHTAREALNVMRANIVAVASLDHDLEHPTENGYWLVKQMLRYGCWPLHRPSIHSANPDGAANMTAFVLRYGPYDR